MIRRIEVDFAIPVELSVEHQKALALVIVDIIKANTPPGQVHWLFGFGSRPSFSQADAAFLGHAADPGAPATGEPTSDDSIYHMETACRDVS